MNLMETKLLSDELLAELRNAAKFAVGSERDPQVMKMARARMLMMREQIYRNHGLLDIGVPAIRELRDGKDA
jgi:hypothetical protein